MGEREDLAPVKSLSAATESCQAKAGDNVKSEITWAKGKQQQKCFFTGDA